MQKKTSLIKSVPSFFSLSIPSPIFYTIKISMADAAHVVGSDYVGISSGNKMRDKFAKAGFTATRSQLVNAPIINELAVDGEMKNKNVKTKVIIKELDQSKRVSMRKR